VSSVVAQARLKDAFKVFMTRWERTGQDWNDAARQDIHTRHVEPLRQQVNAALAAMARAGEAVVQTRQQCQ
jgi:hypothetical protein